LSVARPSPFPVLAYLLVGWRRTWRGSVFSTFLLPAMFLVAMGLSVGAYVDRRGALGVPYLDFLAPGLLASTAFQAAVNEATWPVLGGFEWRRTFYAMQATPLRPADIVGGQGLFLGVRSAIAATGFLVSMTVFGVVHSWWVVAALPAAVLLGVAASLPVVAFAATIHSDNMFALINRFLLIPMSLFAGVFFPVSLLPTAARWLAYASPLWHGVELCRSATFGTGSAPGIAVHVGYLLVWALVGYRLAVRRFTVRLMT
jgi:lipooligosaccharide transport system permease protein